jgi:hypothetical protein
MLGCVAPTYLSFEGGTVFVQIRLAIDETQAKFCDYLSVDALDDRVYAVE